jgi:very-short-patch-repair endonuclease
MRKNKQTSIEKAIQKEFDSLGLIYEIQYTGIPPWVIDFAFPDHRLAIEIDGVYWHSLKNVKEKDARKDKDLTNKGWQIIHFTGDEIRESTSNCVDKIIHILRK